MLKNALQGAASGAIGSLSSGDFDTLAELRNTVSMISGTIFSSLQKAFRRSSSFKINRDFFKDYDQYRQLMMDTADELSEIFRPDALIDVMDHMDRTFQDGR